MRDPSCVMQRGLVESITHHITDHVSRLRFTSILLDPFMSTGVELELGRMSKLEGQRQRF